MLRIIHSVNLLLIAVLSIGSVGQEPLSHSERSTYDKIKTLKPKIKDRLARRIGLAIDENCPKIQRDLVVAIIFVESSFRPESVSETGDRGLGQLAPTTIQEYGLDIRRLFGVAYNVQQACRVLAAKQRWYHYHSRTPSKARVYKAKVKKAYLKIQERKI